MKMTFRWATGVLFALVLLAGPAFAQQFPNRPIIMVAPFSAGGSVDMAARIFAAAMSAELGQPIQVENVGGAGSIRGAERVARAQPDGHTILYNSSNLVFNLSLYRRLPYDLWRDFAPIARTATGPQVLAATRALPISNFQDFVAHARANPGAMNFPSSGPGNITHVMCEFLMRVIGSSAVHVPYSGGATQYPDLLAGRTHFAMASATTIIPFHASRELNVLAVTSAEPLPQLPGVPTFASLGFPQLTVGAWQGLLAPAGTPPAVLALLERAANRAAADPRVAEALALHGLTPFPSSGAEYALYMRAEGERWGPLMREIGIEPQ
jgi:tripartite-type tricarboxylate transporter receptor subunit TctC